MIIQLKKKKRMRIQMKDQEVAKENMVKIINFHYFITFMHQILSKMASNNLFYLTRKEKRIRFQIIRFY